MRRLVNRATLAALAALSLAAWLAPAASRAENLFSPGDLSKAHQSLEGGLETCTKCHVAGEQLSPERCLDCHTELKARIAEKRGFHGRMAPAERQCQSCHHEHQGREEPLVDWGKGGPKGFDHSRTGFPLEGKHRALDCQKCHDPRRVADPAIRTLLEKRPGRKTFLGQATTCAACHFDEHRGQLGQDCKKCHAADAWKPARGFDHARTAFPLTGRHAAVACEECHGDRRDRGFNRPTPRCEGCHQADLARAAGAAVDHAAAGFTTGCRSCHSTWRFKPASFPAHQACFDIRGGPHAGISCLDCHTTLPAVGFTGPLTCDTDTANCIRCHGGVAGAHSGVLGFAMQNRKCYECHRFAAVP